MSDDYPVTRLPLMEGITWAGMTATIRPMRSEYMTNGALAVAAEALTELGWEPMGTVSVNLDVSPAPDCIWVKVWGGNEGLLEQLEARGVLERTGRTMPTGFVEAVEARLIGDWYWSL